MEKVTDWAALWRQLAETRYWRGYNRPEAWEQVDASRHRAREYDARIQHRWSQPDSTRDWILCRVDGETTDLDLGAGVLGRDRLSCPFGKKLRSGYNVYKRTDNSCEEGEYAASDATESCARLRSSAEEPRKMTSELQAERGDAEILRFLARLMARRCAQNDRSRHASKAIPASQTQVQVSILT